MTSAWEYENGQKARFCRAMTQPRDGNRDLPLTSIFHHSCFSLRQTVHRESLCRVITISFAISFTGSPSIYCWELRSSLPTLSFLGPQGFIPPPPSSRFNPPLLAFPSLVFPYERPHSFCRLGSALRDLSLFTPHVLRVCLLSFCPPKRTCFFGFPRQTIPPLFPLHHRL
jgi:hypothetical protein